MNAVETAEVETERGGARPVSESPTVMWSRLNGRPSNIGARAIAAAFAHARSSRRPPATRARAYRRRRRANAPFAARGSPRPRGIEQISEINRPPSAAPDSSAVVRPPSRRDGRARGAGLARRDALARVLHRRRVRPRRGGVLPAVRGGEPRRRRVRARFRGARVVAARRGGIRALVRGQRRRERRERRRARVAAAGGGDPRRRPRRARVRRPDARVVAAAVPERRRRRECECECERRGVAVLPRRLLPVQLPKGSHGRARGEAEQAALGRGVRVPERRSGRARAHERASARADEGRGGERRDEDSSRLSRRQDARGDRPREAIRRVFRSRAEGHGEAIADIVRGRAGSHGGCIRGGGEERVRPRRRRLGAFRRAAALAVRRARARRVDRIGRDARVPPARARRGGVPVRRGGVPRRRAVEQG